MSLKRRLAKWRDPVAWKHLLLPLDRRSPAATAFLGRSLIFALFFLTWKALLPSLAGVGSPIWCVALVWVCALHAGELAHLVGIPKALAMLGAGVALVNLQLIGGLTRAWSRNLRVGAAALILLRAGLGIDLATIRGYGWSFPVFAVVPSIMEAVLSALAARALFGLPYLLALCMAFIIAPVGHAVISSGCANVKERGYARAGPSFLQACCSFDGAFCMVVFQLLLHAYVTLLASKYSSPASAFGTQGSNPGYALPPLLFLASLFGSAVCTLLLAATCLWCTVERRTAMLVACCVALQYGATMYPPVGAGVGPATNLVLGLGVRHAWRTGRPRLLLSEAHAKNVVAEAADMLVTAQRHLTVLWETCMFPLLFGLLGTSFDAQNPPGYASTDAPHDDTLRQTQWSLALCCGYVAISQSIRCVVSVGITRTFKRFTAREQLYIALAWCTKASIQAAFATLPRYTLNKLISSMTNSKGESAIPAAERAQLHQWGNTIVWCCVASVFLSMPVGLVWVNVAPYYLLGRERRLPAAGPKGGLTVDELNAVGDDAAGLEPGGGSDAASEDALTTMQPTKQPSAVSELTSVADVFAETHTGGGVVQIWGDTAAGASQGGGTTNPLKPKDGGPGFVVSLGGGLASAAAAATALGLHTTVTGVPRDMPRGCAILHVALPGVPEPAAAAAVGEEAHTSQPLSPRSTDVDAALAASLRDASAAVVYFHLPEEVDGNSTDGDASLGSSSSSAQPGDASRGAGDVAMRRLLDGGVGNAAQPARSLAVDVRRRSAQQVQPARLWLSYASVAPPAEADVRRALLRAGLDVAKVLAREGAGGGPASRASGGDDPGVGPSGAVAVTVELRRVEEGPPCTHPNVWEDPNDVMLQPPRTAGDDAVVVTGESLRGGLGRRMRRAWRRAPAPVQQHQVVVAQAPPSMPPLSTQRRRRALASERGEDVA